MTSLLDYLIARRGSPAPNPTQVPYTGVPEEELDAPRPMTTTVRPRPNPEHNSLVFDPGFIGQQTSFEPRQPPMGGYTPPAPPGFQAPQAPARTATPLPPKRPARSAYASLQGPGDGFTAPMAPQATPGWDKESGWVDPGILAQQNAEALGKGPGKPGDGVRSFVNNGGLQVFKAAAVNNDVQGPVLPHENTGRHVGYVEGSPAAAAAGVSAPKLSEFFRLLTGGGF